MRINIKLPAIVNDASYVYPIWIGIFIGFFYIPAILLASAGTLLMLIPLWGAILTGIVLLVIDPPSRWKYPRKFSLAARLVSSAIGTALLFSFTTFVYTNSDGSTTFYVGNWEENLYFIGGTWLVYVVATGITFLARKPGCHQTIESAQ